MYSHSVVLLFTQLLHALQAGTGNATTFCPCFVRVTCPPTLYKLAQAADKEGWMQAVKKALTSRAGIINRSAAHEELHQQKTVGSYQEA
eukprot:472238-Pelagomonas_calceolata.AAC.3